jgi:hypothetical protein
MFKTLLGQVPIYMQQMHRRKWGVEDPIECLKLWVYNNLHCYMFKAVGL